MVMQISENINYKFTDKQKIMCFCISFIRFLLKKPIKLNYYKIIINIYFLKVGIVRLILNLDLYFSLKKKNFVSCFYPKKFSFPFNMLTSNKLLCYIYLYRQYN